MTAKLPQSSTSWACYLVFKDRAVVLLPAFCYRRRFSSVPCSTAGAILLFEASGLVNFALPPRPRLFRTRPVASFFRFEEGRGFYFASAPPVNRFRCLVQPPTTATSFPAAFRSALNRFPSLVRRGAASTFFAAPPSTATGDLFNLSGPPALSRSSRSVERLSRSRGRGFYHRRVLCQPTSLTFDSAPT